jgi:LacI family transcriptional regulator
MGLVFPIIEMDGRAGMASIVKHLVDYGHRSIAYIGASDELTLQEERFAGYQLGLESAGIAYRTELVTIGDMTRRGGYRAAQTLFNQRNLPTAIACVNDLTAVGVIQAASERGLRVGRDLAVTGFDGIDDTESVDPSLTSCIPAVYEIARQLMKLLLELLSGKQLKEEQVLLQPEVIVRESSARM